MIEEQQQKYYAEYYAKAGLDRNNLRVNPGVLFQVLAGEEAFLLGMRRVLDKPGVSKVLDVGCGAAGDVYQLLRAGYVPQNITGIDVQRERLDAARLLYPSINFVHMDAAETNFPDGSFDLVFESTMFATLSDNEVSAKIALEMIRVCRPGGYVLLLDWRIPKPGDSAYQALTLSRLASLFKIGTDMRLLGVYHGALVPPVGRFLSARFPAIYFLVSRIFPFLVGQVAYLLQKRPVGPRPEGVYTVVYRSEGGTCNGTLEKGMSFYWWKPSMTSVAPPGLPFLFVGWWLFHILKMFSNREYSILYVKHSGRIVHRSCIIPKYFRSPFMGKDDLQISSTWTDPAYRGKGLATQALMEIVSTYNKPGRRFWYISREENPASIKVAEKAAFTLYAYAKRTKTFKSRLLGHFLLVPCGDGANKA